MKTQIKVRILKALAERSVSADELIQLLNQYETPKYPRKELLYDLQRCCAVKVESLIGYYVFWGIYFLLEILYLFASMILVYHGDWGIEILGLIVVLPMLVFTVRILREIIATWNFLRAQSYHNNYEVIMQLFVH